MQTYNNSVVLKFDDGTTGNADSGAPVTVRVADIAPGAGALATIYDNTGVQILNPLNTDSNGNYSFKVDFGVYDIVIREGQANQYILQDIVISDGAGGGNVADTTLTLVDMDLTPNESVKTRGYYSLDDGGAGEYTVVAAVGYTGNYLLSADITLNNGNIAVLSKYSVVNALQWGLKPDLGAGNTDNVVQFREALRYLKTFNSGGELYIPQAGTGYLTSPLDLSNASNIVITGNYPIVKYDNRVVGDYILGLQNTENIVIEKINFVGVSDEDVNYSSVNRRAGIDATLSSFIIIQDCIFEKFNSLGIFAQNMNGGTYTEGLRILNNTFKDFTYDPTTEVQAGVILSFDAEYSTVTGNSFYRIPAAIRFADGANSIFSHNVVMNLNGAFRSDAAAIYSQTNSNSGKLQITNNKLNHIETGQIVIKLVGDATKPQNPCIISENEILVSGSVSNSQLVVLDDYPNSRVTGNSFRPFATATGNSSVRFNRCDNAIFENNYMRGGDFGITVNAENVYVGKNIWDSQASGKVRLLNLGKFVSTLNSTFSFRVATSGAAGTPWSDTGVTSSFVANGHYRLNHSFGSTNYSVMCMEDNTLAPDAIFSVVRGTSTIDIYIVDAAGAPAIPNFTVNITHGTGSEYTI